MPTLQQHVFMKLAMPAYMRRLGSNLLAGGEQAVSRKALAGKLGIGEASNAISRPMSDPMRRGRYVSHGGEWFRATQALPTAAESLTGSAAARSFRSPQEVSQAAQNLKKYLGGKGGTGGVPSFQQVGPGKVQFNHFTQRPGQLLQGSQVRTQVTQHGLPSNQLYGMAGKNANRPDVARAFGGARQQHVSATVPRGQVTMVPYGKTPAATVPGGVFQQAPKELRQGTWMQRLRGRFA